IFVPVGFFFALLWHKKRFLRALFGGAGISLFIELCQLPMSRATDIDDLILNTLGALFGYILYSWLKKIAPSFISRFEI
ncbi:MAG TPA: VanZ family protein, partial [Firmicutes bacterium]|nr:VanZ family protein [Bacillota bacterium]